MSLHLLAGVPYRPVVHLVGQQIRSRRKSLHQPVARLAELLKEWGIPDTDIARCFVILGCCDGSYPQMKPRKENRFWIIG